MQVRFPPGLLKNIRKTNKAKLTHDRRNLIGSKSLDSLPRGISSVIERKFTKLQVAGLNPASRSKVSKRGSTMAVNWDVKTDD